jgi:radical SAM superfamily enzyme YgiQ (UPF0313 family)
VPSVLRPGLLEKAADAGLRSMFVGFETLSNENLHDHHKHQNLGRDYSAAVRRLHERGVMVNASFVFGMDGDDESVFDRTVEWAISQGIETATFHILTPYPGTALHRRLTAEGRITSTDWDLYDTRHTVYRPAGMSPEALEAGYRRAYHDFYSWGSIMRGAWSKVGWAERLRHVAYSGGWKKLDAWWDLLVRGEHVGKLLPALEAVLDGSSRHEAEKGSVTARIPRQSP